MIQPNIPRRSMQKQIIETFLTFLMEKGWNHTTLEDVANTLNVSIGEIQNILPQKEKIFHLLASEVESSVYSELQDPDIVVYAEKDQVMEILVTKLEAMTPFKVFLKYLRNNFLSHTEISIPFAMAELASLEKILAHYQINQNNLLGELKRKAIFGVYLLAMDTWVQDESPDLAPTLAKLDRLLSKGETFLERYS
ncbi:MAG: hypothetical protein ACK5PQ_00705 [Alphaproteobacteria bacterium]